MYAPALTVRTESHDAPGAPAAALAFEREMGAQNTSELIGDESVVIRKAGDVWVQFRRGSVVVEVEYFAGDEPPPADPVDALLPIARAVAGRLPG